MTKKSDYGYLTEENVDEYIQDLIAGSKGNYINQNVAFSKTNPHQLALLRSVLLESPSFGGFVKKMLTDRFNPSTTSAPTYEAPRANHQFRAPSTVIEQQPPLDERREEINSEQPPTPTEQPVPKIKAISGFARQFQNPNS